MPTVTHLASSDTGAQTRESSPSLHAPSQFLLHHTFFLLTFTVVILIGQEISAAIEWNVLTIYAPMIYTAQRIMFWMRAYPLQGEVGGGWALEFESFLGPVKWQ